LAGCREGRVLLYGLAQARAVGAEPQGLQHGIALRGDFHQGVGRGVLALGGVDEGLFGGTFFQDLGFVLQNLQKFTHESGFLFQAGLESGQRSCHGVMRHVRVEGELGSQIDYLSSSRALAIRDSAIRLVSTLSCPDAMASRSACTLAMSMSWSLFCRAARSRAAPLRSNDAAFSVLPDVAAPTLARELRV